MRRQAAWLAVVLLLAAGCGGDQVVFSDEVPTEPMPSTTSAPAEAPPEVSSGPSLEYQRECLQDPARASERFELARRYGAGELPVRPEIEAVLAKAAHSARDAGLRAQLARALGRAEGAATRGVLLKLLGDPEPAVRRAAAETVAAVDDPALDDRLRAQLETPDNGARRAAVLALGQRDGTTMPGEPPRRGEPLDHMLYLERLSVLDRLDLFRSYVRPRKGKKGGLVFRARPTAADEEARKWRIHGVDITPDRFRDEIAPALLVDLAAGSPCSGWERRKAICRCVSDTGTQYRVKLIDKRDVVYLTAIERQD